MDNDEYRQYVAEDSLLLGMGEQPDPTPAAERFQLAERIAELYRDLKAEQRNQKALYLPQGEWAHYLEERSFAYGPLVNGSAADSASLLGNFWRNELGHIVKQYATFQTLQASAEERQRFTDLMAYDFMIWRNLFDEPPSTLAVPPVGNPWGCRIEAVTVAPKAVRYHALATQIRQILSDRSRPVVAEIGAGYGGAAYYLLRGDQPMTYVDFDLPEVLVLAAYYLSRSLPHRKVFLYRPGAELSAAALERYDVLLFPNWRLPDLPARSVDLFLNTFSLSEMPYEVIEEYIRQIERTSTGYFLHNNMDRSGVFNRGHERVPCSRYPISPRAFKQLYRRYDLFQRKHFGRDGDYREVLLERTQFRA